MPPLSLRKRPGRAALLAGSCLLALACASGGHSAASGAVSPRLAGPAGRRVHYEVFGKGEPALVFVHGWSCDMTFWDEQTPHFAARHRVVLIDLPGHGRSEVPEGELSMDVFADAIDAVLRDVKIPAAVLVGHSMGTPVIRQFYRRYPGKTLALVAVDGALRPFSKDPKAGEGFLGPLRGDGYLPAFTKMVNGMTAPVPDERKRERIRKAMLATPQSVVVRAGDGMFDSRIWGDDPIRVPLLVVSAKSSGWPSDYEAWVRTLAPRARYVEMEGVSHFLMMDDPAKFNGLLDSFLDTELSNRSR
ncbi:MAG: alpha/beta hydrolase [Acidobacteriota bacterium]|nr:alpha/beta hydrolase [Acidobacteriota bacterium]